MVWLFFAVDIVAIEPEWLLRVPKAMVRTYRYRGQGSAWDLRISMKWSCDR